MTYDFEHIERINKMKKMATWILLVVLGLALAGCGATARGIRAKSFSERSDVFSEIEEDERVLHGFVELVIRASVKSHLEGFYLLEQQTLHGKPEYPFLLNIDGQAVTWEVDSPNYDGKGRKNPEGGQGMRYVLIKKLQLKSGLHEIFFALPGENKTVETTITLTLNEKELSILEFKPIYYRYGGPTFERGVSRLEVFLDGKPIQ